MYQKKTSLSKSDCFGFIGYYDIYGFLFKIVSLLDIFYQFLFRDNQDF